MRPIVSDRSIVVLKPGEFEPVKDAQAVESEYSGRPFAEVEYRRHKCHLAVEDLVECIAKRPVAWEVVDGPFGVELGVAPVDDAPMRDIDEVVPRIRRGSS